MVRSANGDLSDHNYIAFTVGAAILASQRELGWSTRHMDQGRFLASLASWKLAEEYALALSMDCSTPKKSPATTRRKSVHWWSPELSELRRNRSNDLWNVYQRKKRRGKDCHEEWNTAKSAKLLLVNAIKRAKQAVWAELCMMVDADLWGKPYRLVMTRLGPRRLIPGIHMPGRMNAIVDGLFLTHPIRTHREWPRDETVVAVIDAEVRELALRIPSNKAPGPDGIPGRP